MKKTIIILGSLILSTGASAQRKGFHRSHVRIYAAPINYGIGFGYPYPYFGYPVFEYPFGYGYYPYGYAPMQPYGLNRQIASIRTQYRYKIKAARKDKSIAKPERKQEVLNLKSERENAINNAEMNYRRQRMNYRQRMNINNYQNNPNMNDNPGTNNNLNSGNSSNNQNSDTSYNQNI